MPLQDLVFGPETSPVERIRDIESRLTLVLLDPSREDLYSFLHSRTRDVLGMARSTLESQLGSTEVAALAPDADRDFRAVAAGLESCFAALGTPSSRSGQLVRDWIDDTCVQIQEESIDFAHGFASHLDLFGSVTSKSLRYAYEKLGSALKEVGSDRYLGLQAALDLFRDLTKDEEGAQSPYTWLAYGWFQTNLTLNLEEAEQAFFRSVLCRRTSADALEIQASRNLAHVQSQRGSTAAAYSAVQKALSIREDPDSLLDAARYALASQRASECAQLLERAILAQPLAMAMLFADSSYEALHLGRAELAMRAQSASRSHLESEINALNHSIDRIRNAVSTAGVSLPLPLRGYDAGSGSPQSLSYFEAELQRGTATERRSESSLVARRTLEDVRLVKTDAVNLAQKALDDAWNEREAVGKDTQTRHASLVAAARDRANAGLPDPAKVQQGCSWSLGVGCGGLAIYVFLAIILGTIGVAIGPETLVGKLSILLVLTPPTLAAVLQMLVSARQAALQGEMWREIEQSRKQADDLAEQANALYRARLPKLREPLLAAQQELKKLDDAIEMLGRLD